MATDLDDEFFTDLYTDDDPSAPPATSVAAPAEQSVEDAPAPESMDANERPQQNGNGDVNIPHDDDDEEEDDDDDIDFNLGGNASTSVPTADNFEPEEQVHDREPEPEPMAEQQAPSQDGYTGYGTYASHVARVSHDSHGPPQRNNASPANKEDGKMFIGGLNWETTDQSLRDYFAQFGEVTECTVMRDVGSGRSRGFGFLTFKDPKTVNVVMVKEHHLDGKIIDPKRAIPRDEQEKTSKIFVGGVSQDCTDAEFKAYFAEFGRVVDATLMMDKDTGRPRGFGFVTFESEAGVEACLSTDLEIHGKQIEVKKAQPRGSREEEESGGRRGKFGKKQFGGANDTDLGSGRGSAGGAGGGGNGGGGGDNSMGGHNGATANNGMSPANMAQAFQRMQQWMTILQQNQMMQGTGRGAPNMPPQMNPAMWQHMQMQMQQQQQQQQMMMEGRGGPGGPAGVSPNPAMMAAGMGGPGGQMNPAMLQQMQQHHAQMMAQQQQGGGPGQGGPQGGPSQGQGGPRPGYNAFEQQMFEQQKYEQQGGNGPQQQQQQGGSGGYGNQGWEGMYEDGSAGGVQQGQGSSAGFGSCGGGGGGGGRQRGQGPPANAPTGPKNAGRPGANFYRGGGGERRVRQFHPYAR